MNNNFTILPEIILLNFLLSSLKWIKEDIVNNKDTPEKSYIYQVFNNNKLQRYDYYKEAKEVFSRDVDHNKYVKVHTEFDYEKENPPVLIIGEAYDSLYTNGIGNGEGIYQDENTDSNTYYPVYSKMRQAQFDITIFSNNSNEILMIFQLVKSLFLTFSPSLQLMGLMELEVKTNKKEKADLVPDLNFKKKISVEFYYQHNSPIITTVPNWNDFDFLGKMIN